MNPSLSTPTLQQPLSHDTVRRMESLLEWQIPYMLGEGKGVKDLSGITEQEFLSWEGVGPDTVEYVSRQLAAEGLSFKPEPLQIRARKQLKKIHRELFPGEELKLENFTRVTADEFLRQFGAGPRLLAFARVQLAAAGLSFRGETVPEISGTPLPLDWDSPKPRKPETPRPAPKRKEYNKPEFNLLSSDQWENRRWEATVMLYSDLVARLGYQKKGKAARLATDLAQALVDEYCKGSRKTNLEDNQ